jgi:hypothetical protein
MKHATLEDFDTIKNIFKKHRDVFPYLRFDSLKNKIEEGKVVYDTGVVITYNKYKRKQKLGNVQAKMGDIVIQEIVKGEDGSVVDVFARFVDFVNEDVWLTVRRDNKRAKKFYDKVGMKVVGEVFWSKGTLAGDVYFYRQNRLLDKFAKS